ncbi:MAG: hypothetical protein SF051_12705 [Elusimicrobiota bacterium]|nr:hypothetical protein [Elusimicrobiota bacterium]
MRPLLLLSAAFLITACKKEAAVEAPAPAAPAGEAAVPISNDPRQGVRMIDAAKDAAARTEAAAATHDARAKEALGD